MVAEISSPSTTTAIRSFTRDPIGTVDATGGVGSQELAVRWECRGRRAGRDADDIGEQCEASSPRRLDVTAGCLGLDAVGRDRLFTLGTRRLEGGPSRGGSGVLSSGIP